MFRNAISLKLVVRTYMGGFTPVYNGKKVLKVFFKTAIWLPYGQLWGQLHSSKVNHCVLHFRPESRREPRNEVGSLSPAECLVQFEPRTFRFLLLGLNLLGHSLQQFPLEFPYIQYLLDSIYEKSTICNLVSDGTNFVPSFRNTDQLLQIDVNKFLILILFLQHHLFHQHNIESTIIIYTIIIYQLKQSFNLM